MEFRWRSIFMNYYVMYYIHLRQITMVTKEKIKSMILQLPVEEINQLIEEITETMGTKDFMKLAETGFQEWNDPEEDIYSNEAEN